MMTNEAHGMFALTTDADEALADSGCRVAVGGEKWHYRLQGIMTALGIEFFEVEEDERFLFGSGTVLTSRKAFVYALGIMGDPEAARISCVPGSCPGLVSPTEMSRWNIGLNFGNRTMTKGTGEPRTISQSASGNPSFRLTEFGNHDIRTIWQHGRMKQWKVLLMQEESRRVYHIDNDSEPWPSFKGESSSEDGSDTGKDSAWHLALRKQHVKEG